MELGKKKASAKTMDPGQKTLEERFIGKAWRRPGEHAQYDPAAVRGRAVSKGLLAGALLSSSDPGSTGGATVPAPSFSSSSSPSSSSSSSSASSSCFKLPIAPVPLLAEGGQPTKRRGAAQKKTGGKKPKKMPEVAAVVKAGAPASNPPTPLQLLNSECQRRRVSLHDNTFVAGHCFF